LTEADSAAQAAIVGSLRATWGESLNIIGEEDDDEELVRLMESSTFEPLDKSLFEEDIGETPELDASEVIVYVDPLDGTREFVEGRIENCQALVGIATAGCSAAGAIGIPFPAKHRIDNSLWNIRCLYRCSRGALDSRTFST
jgi:3'(2'), 5'-bisphosphate nucleotidase